MKHVMVDLETLGTKQNSAFISIGACEFNPNTGIFGKTFYKNIDWDDALETRGVTGDTIKWWISQSKEAKEKIVLPGKMLEQTLFDFSDWFRDGQDFSINIDKKIWGNGAAFDVAMMENAYDEMAIEIPWEFWNVRDVRTIVDIADGIVNKNDIPFEGVKHDALSDAIYQAKYVSAMWQALRSKGE